MFIYLFSVGDVAEGMANEAASDAIRRRVVGGNEDK